MLLEETGSDILTVFYTIFIPRINIILSSIFDIFSISLSLSITPIGDIIITSRLYPGSLP
jgi:hypothetical protein